MDKRKFVLDTNQSASTLDYMAQQVMDTVVDYVSDIAPEPTEMVVLSEQVNSNPVDNEIYSLTFVDRTNSNIPVLVDKVTSLLENTLVYAFAKAFSAMVGQLEMDRGMCDKALSERCGNGAIEVADKIEALYEWVLDSAMVMA